MRRANTAASKKMVSRGYCLAITLLAITSECLRSSAEYITCNQPKTFDVTLGNGQKYLVFDTVLLVKYNPNVTVYTYPDTPLVNLLFQDCSAFFTARMVPVESKNAQPEKITWGDMGSIVGIGELKNVSKEDSRILKHRVFLPGNRAYSENLPIQVRNEIEAFAQTCIGLHVCKDVKSVSPKQITAAKDFEFGPLSVTSRSVSTFFEQDLPSCLTDEKMPTKTNVNGIVDLAMRNFVWHIKQKNLQKTRIPNIKKSFQSGRGLFSIHGSFAAAGGTFGDLATLYRIGNASFAVDGDKYSITTGLGISRAILNYNRYELKYGLISVHGNLKGDIGRVYATGNVEVDFAESPCRIIVKSIHVNDMGKLDLQATGLGPLNSLLSSIMTWMTGQWKSDIVRRVEADIQRYAQREAIAANCEKYRDMVSEFL